MNYIIYVLNFFNDILVGMHNFYLLFFFLSKVMHKFKIIAFFFFFLAIYMNNLTLFLKKIN